jgi:hypothetical protein
MVTLTPFSDKLRSVTLPTLEYFVCDPVASEYSAFFRLARLVGHPRTG